ncbi:hypothetical protein FGG08_006609 [Glutinoglossum americanum]|uniref:Uncharacterized protein n=1 Tax=Glutinoglossum americanum TaxID=1670608 RepID=A0A9P8I167_9PEZI|nr:hypothetical protein FGG08_006609 [Glutinoglossum americanum]
MPERWVAKGIAAGFVGGASGCIVLVVFSAIATARDREDGVAIAHLCLSIPLLILIITAVALYASERGISRAIMLVDTFIWLGLLVSLVSVPRSRAKLSHDYKDQSQYHVHPYFGMIVIDCCELIIGLAGAV